MKWVLGGLAGLVVLYLAFRMMHRGMNPEGTTQSSGGPIARSADQAATMGQSSWVDIDSSGHVTGLHHR